jgi:uncharacterized protein YukE
MSPLKEILVPESIVPPEAYGIAASFRREASRVRELAAQNRNIKGTFDYTWEGLSKNKFSGDYDPQIGQLDNYANLLEEKARQIENIHVTVWKKKFVKS